MEELLKSENQHLIPEEWKKGWTYFFGTIFRGSDARLSVPCLRWFGGGWSWHISWLGDSWLHNYYTASLAIHKSSEAR